MLYAAEAGWGHEARFALNDALTGYVEEFERMASATEERPYRPPRKQRHTRKVPVYSTAELLAFLGIDPEKQKAKQVLEAALTPDMWAAFDEGEWDTADPE